jgi:hypothetical protein
MIRDKAKANFALQCMHDIAGRYQDIGLPLSFTEQCDLFTQFYESIKGGQPTAVDQKIRELWGKPD